MNLFVENTRSVKDAGKFRHIKRDIIADLIDQWDEVVRPFREARAEIEAKKLQAQKKER